MKTKENLNSIADTAIVHKEAKLESPVMIYPFAEIAKNTKIGSFSYINKGTTIFYGTSIGKYCSIGKNCEIGVIDHPMDWLSTSPIQYKIHKQFPYYKEFSEEFPQIKKTYPLKTLIGNDVWIGSLVIIKRGITIGDGAVIGAGSIVTKDVPPYAIVAGVPAKIIRYRFKEDIIKELLALKWWNIEFKKLAGIQFNDIQKAIVQLKAIKKSKKKSKSSASSKKRGNSKKNFN